MCGVGGGWGVGVARVVLKATTSPDLKWNGEWGGGGGRGY